MRKITTILLLVILATFTMFFDCQEEPKESGPYDPNGKTPPTEPDSGKRLDTTRRHPQKLPDETPPGGG